MAHQTIIFHKFTQRGHILLYPISPPTLFNPRQSEAEAAVGFVLRRVGPFGDVEGKRNPGSGIYVTTAKCSPAQVARERRQFHGPLARLWFTLVGALFLLVTTFYAVSVGVSSSVQNNVVVRVPSKSSNFLIDFGFGKILQTSGKLTLNDGFPRPRGAEWSGVGPPPFGAIVRRSSRGVRPPMFFDCLNHSRGLE